MSSAQDIERDGFVKMTVVAITANMAASHIVAMKMIVPAQIAAQAMELTEACWDVIMQERQARKDASISAV